MPPDLRVAVETVETCRVRQKPPVQLKLIREVDPFPGLPVVGPPTFGVASARSFFPFLGMTWCAQPLRQKADNGADDEAGHHDFQVGMLAIHRIGGGHKKGE